nr:hypothetical protein [uncultured Undibacterium sp.]
MISYSEKFKQDWQRDEEIASLCKSLFEYLEHEENREEHFTFSRLKAIAHAENEQKLAKALQYLSSPGCRVFRQVFLFIDDDFIQEFSAAEMAEIYRESEFAHPKFGYVISDLNEISVAFECGDYFQDTGSVVHG